MNRTFPKIEKLKRQKIIERLFSEGFSYNSFPLKAFCISESSLVTTQAAFSVPKRRFKNAVDRNRIKRQIREAYRLQKESFEKESGKKIAVLFMYTGKDQAQFDSLLKAMDSLLKKCYAES